LEVTLDSTHQGDAHRKSTQTTSAPKVVGNTKNTLGRPHIGPSTEKCRENRKSVKGGTH
jgi:hypothetical protein